MKKIILIEDRYKRQELFVKELNFEFEKYHQIVDNFVLNDFVHLANELLHDSSSLLDYDIIICHKSVQLEDDKDSNGIITSRLIEFCKQYQKILIFFSGGISTNFYNKSEFELLELNSKTFYSKNLLLFLDAVKDNNEDIIMLCYGEHWKENVVANVLEKTNIFIQKSTEEDIEYTEFANFVDIEKCTKVDYDFYQMQIENGWVYLNEIIKFLNSLKQFFIQLVSNQNSISNKYVLIHNNNIFSLSSFQERIRFITTDSNIDRYISQEIIKKLQDKDVHKLFIKDNLSANYLELLGLRVAYHIRLSSKLGDKRNIPIIIVSDFSVEQLNKFDELAKILFTPNIYLCKNTKEDIEKYQSLELQNLTLEKYNQEFLNKIKINPPKDYLSHHSIANEWSIYRWAKFLKVDDNKVIRSNKAKIENMLYFKYLKAKYKQTDTGNALDVMQPTNKGKVLLIDDEWNKGWSDILKKALQKDGLEFQTFEFDFKDKSQSSLIVQLDHKELKSFVENADVIILDLRLLQNDHETDDIDNYTGIKLLQKIHEINAGIQVIMLTATSKSIILEKLYEKKILGYIKKEHPDDMSINTIENINKLISLVDKGLEKKYLKTIFNTKENLSRVLSTNIIQQYGLQEELYKLYLLKLRNESEYVFDIVDSDTYNKFAYAMLSISSSLETVLSIFLKERQYDNIFWDQEEYISNKLEDKLIKLLSKLGSQEAFNFYPLIKQRNDYLHANDNYKPVSWENIENWYLLLEKLILEIKSPANYIPYAKKRKKKKKYNPETKKFE